MLWKVPKEWQKRENMHLRGPSQSAQITNWPHRLQNLVSQPHFLCHPPQRKCIDAVIDCYTIACHLGPSDKPLPLGHRNNSSLRITRLYLNYLADVMGAQRKIWKWRGMRTGGKAHSRNWLILASCRDGGEGSAANNFLPCFILSQVLPENWKLRIKG